LAFEYVEKNNQHLQSINADRSNVLIEQHLFYALAKEKNLPIGFLFQDLFNDNGYKHVGDFHEVPFRRTYLHLLGPFKKDESTCIQMSNKLRELYPYYYYKILSLFRKKGIMLNHRCFNNNSIISDTNYSALHEKARQEYNSNNTNSENTVVDETSNTHLLLLKKIANLYSGDNDEMKKDFSLFYDSLITVLKKNMSFLYLYGRDLSSSSWYRDLFSDETGLLTKQIVQSAGIEIISSRYDWAGLFNKHYRIGVEYYKKLQIKKGEYWNLIVQEVSDNRFSIYDIKYLYKMILDCLSEPLSINELLLRMHDCFDEEVIKDHYQSYINVIITCLKQLVIMKAIK